MRMDSQCDVDRNTRLVDSNRVTVNHSVQTAPVLMSDSAGVANHDAATHPVNNHSVSNIEQPLTQTTSLYPAVDLLSVSDDSSLRSGDNESVTRLPDKSVPADSTIANASDRVPLASVSSTGVDISSAASASSFNTSLFCSPTWDGLASSDQGIETLCHSFASGAVSSADEPVNGSDTDTNPAYPSSGSPITPDPDLNRETITAEPCRRPLGVQLQAVKSALLNGAPVVVPSPAGPIVPGPVSVPHVIRHYESLTSLESETVRPMLHNTPMCRPCGIWPDDGNGEGVARAGLASRSLQSLTNLIGCNDFDAPTNSNHYNGSGHILSGTSHLFLSDRDRSLLDDLLTVPSGTSRVGDRKLTPGGANDTNEISISDIADHSLAGGSSLGILGVNDISLSNTTDQTLARSSSPRTPDANDAGSGNAADSDGSATGGCSSADKSANTSSTAEADDDLLLLTPNTDATDSVSLPEKNREQQCQMDGADCLKASRLVDDQQHLSDEPDDYQVDVAKTTLSSDQKAFNKKWRAALLNVLCCCCAP